ncbi:hypothetical protein CPLU01_07212 [Colletotrichum plurivorum]|uniref:Nephrocystin 3-like N-terminal domain-containing protein n=1 Tax=Colletotrichum plurivorum TaxID=2175906 RepID=A0A8H6NEP3_9PEZI|nr:hypothetical protein CPLU01_07212 [Colletotrichum plurivorum]
MEAAGLASSILAFIEVSYKITKGAYEIYTSVSGSTEEHVHVVNVISDLERASGRLAAPGRVDSELASLSYQCRALSQELLDLLQKLQVKDKNVLRSFCVAFASARKQKEIASIEKRLDQYRQQILLRLTVLICQNQSPIQDQLVEIRRESEVLENKRGSELEKLQSQLVELVQALKIQQPGKTALVKEKTEEAQGPSHESTHLTTEGEQQQPTAKEETTRCPTPPKAPPPGTHPVLGDLSGLIDELNRLYGTVRSENSVLRELYFDSISRREGAVHQAASETFHWILGDVDDEEESQCSDSYTSDSDDSDNDGAEEETPDWDAEEKRQSKLDFEMMIQRETELRRATSETFMSFLESDGDAFFIYGKAGSGKSSLMKFLSQHERVNEALEHWSDGRQLVRVNMFFWSAGTDLQKSLEGLYRTILFHTLRQCPDLIAPVFRDVPRDNFTGLSTSGLRQAIDQLARLDTSATHAFCYFVDGLDEYEGDAVGQKQLGDLLSTWSRSKNVKVVCSSRPYTVFMDIFRHETCSVGLHHLTKSDMCQFAQTQFEEHLAGSAYEKERGACIELVEPIVNKAEGVFLWASLVVRSLLNAGLEHDDASSLAEKLEDCPSDLNGLFHQMLGAVGSSPSLRHRSSLILFLMKFPWFRRNALAKSPGSPSSTETSNYDGKSPYFDFSLMLFHRTVRDFLYEEWFPKLQSQPLATLEDRANALCQLTAAEAKFAPAVPRSTPFVPPMRAHSQYLSYKAFFMILKSYSRKGCRFPLRYIKELEESACGTPGAQGKRLASPLLTKCFEVHARLACQENRWAVSEMSNWGVNQVSFLHLAASHGDGECVEPVCLREE